MYYGSPYGIFTIKTLHKYLQNSVEKIFRRIFLFSNNSALFFIASCMYKSSSNYSEKHYFASTSLLYSDSCLFYNDHYTFLCKTDAFFAIKISPAADKLIENIETNIFTVKQKNPQDIMQEYATFISSGKKDSRVPGYYFDPFLQDLEYNKKTYNVVFSSTYTNLPFFAKNYSEYGYLFHENYIDYKNEPAHPYYLHNVKMRDFKQENFLYDILTSSTKDVIFYLDFNTNFSLIKKIIADPNSNIFVNIENQYAKMITRIVKFKENKLEYYFTINKEEIAISFDTIDTSYLECIIHTLNYAIRLKKTIVTL